ncbi:hypothetical protein P9112_014191 [Eukaryota sp. TZLM1-RC]
MEKYDCCKLTNPVSQIFIVLNREAMTHPTPSASLYVGDLHHSTTEEELRETFSTVGTVTGVLVPKNTYNSRPLGYAYINLETAEDVQKALDQLNYTNFHGKPCRLMFSDRHPEKRKSGVGILVVKNIHPDIDVTRLRVVFSQFGAILSAKISTDEEGHSLGYGYVQFQDSLCADNALKELNGKEISAKGDAEAKSVITVQKCIPLNAIRLLGVQNLILNCFSDFATLEQAEEAVDELQGHTIGDYEVNAEFFLPKKIRARIREKNFYRTLSELKQAFKDRKLWVGDLPQDYTDEQFKDLFASYGNVISASIMRTPDGVSRQFGFVCFESPEEANNAISNLNGKIPDQALQPLRICFFKPQKERIELKKQEAAVDVAVSATQPSVPTDDTGAEPLDEKQRFIEMLRNENDEATRREALGDRLCPLVEAKNAELASKIIGMILCLDWVEIEKDYLDDDYLDQTVKEVLEALHM